jgi:tRNA(fMet)-specific endonuclease VapC
VNGYLFDTCTVRKWWHHHAQTEAYTSNLKDNDFVYVSAITIGEIEFAHSGIEATDPQQQAEFMRWIHNEFEVPQLAVTASTAIYYAQFRRTCFSTLAPKKFKFIESREDMLGEKLGIDENDLWIAAQACERNLILVTNDKMARLVQAVGGTVQIDFIPD